MIPLNITIVYQEIFETTCRHLVDSLQNEYNYILLDISKVLRFHISTKTELGSQCADFLNSKSKIPDVLLNKIFKLELEKLNSKDVLIKGYPYSVEQVESLEELCSNNNYSIKNIWHFKSLNKYENILSNAKYTPILDQFESEEIAKDKMRSSRARINKILSAFKNYSNLFVFESEALGVNFHEDKLRLKTDLKDSLNDK